MASFIGSTNLFKGEVEGPAPAPGRIRVRTDFGLIECNTEPGVDFGPTVILAIRPEDIVLHRSGAPAGLAHPNVYESRIGIGLFTGTSVEYYLDVGSTLIQGRHRIAHDAAARRRRPRRDPAGGLPRLLAPGRAPRCASPTSGSHGSPGSTMAATTDPRDPGTPPGQSPVPPRIRRSGFALPRFEARTIAILATALVLIYLVLGPLLMLIVSSFKETEGTLPFEEGVPWTIANFVQVLTDPGTYRVLLNTFLFAAGALTVSFTLAITFAWLIERTDLPLRNVLFVVISPPSACPT